MKDFGTPSYKLRRNVDPDTSHGAARRVDTTRLEGIVYQIIVDHGEHGCIADDVLEIAQGEYGIKSYSSVTARFKALAEKGWIDYSGERRPGRSGRAQRVMVKARPKKPETEVNEKGQLGWKV